MLQLYKVGAYTELHTDVSKYGAVLLQLDSRATFNILLYVNGCTTAAEKNYIGYTRSTCDR